MLGGRLIGPGLSVSLLPFLVFVLAWIVTADNFPPAKTGYGPFNGQHCHRGEDLDPPVQGTVRHTHNDFHSGSIPAAEWEDFKAKFKKYLEDEAVHVEQRDAGLETEYRIVSFPSNWKPEDQDHWHNHGDDDTFWWTPDEGNNDSCDYAPEFTQASYSFSLAENAPAGTPVGMVQASDQDSDRLRHTLEGTGSNHFSIESVTGQINVKTPPDYEVRPKYSLIVRATDPGGSHAIVSVSISVANVEEAGTVSVSGAFQAGARVTAALRDPDGAIQGPTWAWEKATREDGPWDASSETSATLTLGASDVGHFIRARATYSDGHGDGKTAESPPVAVRAQPASPPRRTEPRDRSTSTPTPTPTAVPLSVPGPTTRATSTPTPTPTNTATPTPRPTNTATPTPRPTNTPKPSPTPTMTPLPSFTPLPVRSNNPPIFQEGASTNRTTRAGLVNAQVGAPVVAVDPDGDPIAYSRDGTDLAQFILNTATGQVWAAQALPSGSFSLRLWATDGRGGADFIDIDITAEAQQPEETGLAPIALPTSTPYPTPALKAQQVPVPTPTLKPDPTEPPTATPIDMSGWGPGRTIGTWTPTPDWGVSVVDAGNPRPPAGPVVLAQSGPILNPAPWWPRALLWIGGALLAFALAWLILVAHRNRRQGRR